MQEEIFGPVLSILTYKDIDQAIELANDHQFGLASLVYTESYRDAVKIADNIEAGEFYINRIPADPHQGYHRGSGLGGDNGKHGMLNYTQPRLIIAKY